MSEDEYERYVRRQMFEEWKESAPSEWARQRREAFHDGTLVGVGGEEPQQDPTAVSALAPLLRTGKLSRYRVLDVVCPNSHRLAQVLRASGGLLIVGKGRVLETEERRVGGTFEAPYDPETGEGGHEVDWDDTLERNTVRNRAVEIVVWLHDYMEGTTPGTFRAVDVQCRCRTVFISGLWIEDQIKQRRRRVVLDSGGYPPRS